MCRRCSNRWFMLGLLLAAVGVTVWWLQMDEDRQRFYKNILRQVPDLPARYSV